MSQHFSSSRRQFLAGSGSLLGAAALGFPAITSARSPNNRLTAAFIGTGGRGGANLAAMESLVDVVALCDVDQRSLDAAKAKHASAKTYVDFRELHQNMEKIDAVVVSTTEHTHAFATLPALRAKKHVYCEKPLSRDVHEARLMMQAAQDAEVTTQMGTQIHAGENYRRVVEAVRGGLIGSVSEVHVCVSRAWGAQSAEDAVANQDLFADPKLLPYTNAMPTEGMPVPDYMNWDLWIGPAEMRPFHEIYHPGPRWYRYWNFANGTMSDLGSHQNDLPFWALDLDHPTEVSATGPDAHPEIVPASMSATWKFAKKGNRDAVTLNFYQGKMQPQLVKDGKVPAWGNGVLFVGSEGMILADYSKMTVLPERKFANVVRPPKSIPSSPGHHQEFVECAMAGKKASCDFAYSGLLTVSNHLGGVAYRSKTSFKWDPVAGQTNEAVANAYLARQYREGWSL